MHSFQRTHCIFASKVAELIGHHRYNPQAAAVYNLIAKWRPELIQMRNQNRAVTTWEQEVKQAAASSGQSPQVPASTPTLTPTPQDLQGPPQDPCALIRIQRIQQAQVNHHQGRTEEPVAIAQYQAQHQTIVTGNNAQGFSLEIPDVSGTTRWILYGKVDGFDGQQLIEVKNRVNRLFCTIPLYERIQMECYMRMTGSESCKLVQRHQDRLDSQVLTRDDALWHDLILPGLKMILEKLDAFCYQTTAPQQHKIIVEPLTHTLVLEQICNWFEIPHRVT